MDRPTIILKQREYDVYRLEASSYYHLAYTEEHLDL